MAKGVGLDAGDYEIKVVEVDGSYRKLRLSKVSIERVPADAEGSAEAVQHALKDAHISSENVTLGVAARESVIRILTIPFVGTESIRKVIKFEAESSIHSHNVDDMVVDFHTLAPGEGETKVLVMAVPKAHLKARLATLERAGLDPEWADSDLMALFRAAEWSGALTDALSQAQPVEPAESAALATVPSEPRSRVVIDIGARSLCILVTREGKLVDMRSMRTGTDAIADELGASHGLELSQAREGVWHALSTQGDYELPVVVPESSGEEAQAPATTLPVQAPALAYTEVQAATQAFLLRLRRELMRFNTSLSEVGNCEIVWLTGGGSALPGVVELLEELFACPCRPLDLLGNLNHNLDDEVVAQVGPRIAVALGLALRPFGGIGGFNFRQEDLGFTKRFDRIKFPLAIASMLLLFLAVVFMLKSRQELSALKYEYGETIPAAAVAADKRGNRPAQPAPAFYGFVGSLMNSGEAPLKSEKSFERADYIKLANLVAEKPVFTRLGEIRSAVVARYRKLQADSGYYEDLKLGSGLGVLNEASAVIAATAPRLGRFQVGEIELRLLPVDATRFLQLRLAFRGSDYTSKFVALQDAFAQAAKEPNSSFKAVGKTTEKETPFTEGEESGAYYTLRLDLKSEKDFPAFPPRSRTN